MASYSDLNNFFLAMVGSSTSYSKVQFEYASLNMPNDRNVSKIIGLIQF